MASLFKLQERNTSVQKEIVAGITTFLAMSYILAVNPGMLSQTGMSAGGVFTATALASGITTIIMAFLANLPVALAPGMGLNAFFTYTVCMGMGYSWQIALTAVFLEGILFIILSLFNVREAIIKAIPANMKKAVAVGIGLFITIIGLNDGGIVSSSTGTIIGFGDIHQGAALVAIIGLVITTILFVLNVPGSILIGIIVTTIIGAFVPATRDPVTIQSLLLSLHILQKDGRRYHFRPRRFFASLTFPKLFLLNSSPCSSPSFLLISSTPLEHSWALQNRVISWMTKETSSK